MSDLDKHLLENKTISGMRSNHERMQSYVLTPPKLEAVLGIIDELIAKVNYYESVIGLADVLVDIPIDQDKAHLPPPF